MLTAETPTTAITSSTRERPAAARKRLHAVSLTVLTEFVASVSCPRPVSTWAAPNTSPNSCQPPSLSTNQRTAQSIFFLPVFNLVVCHSPLFFQLVVSSFHLCVWAESSRIMNHETRVWILIWLRRIKLRRVIWLATFQTCPSPCAHGWLVDLMSLDRKPWLVRWEMAEMGLDEQRWQLVDESASG